MTNKNPKIEKYHFEEIVYMLLILATDLSRYDDDHLINFTESLEGRVVELFDRGFLSSFEVSYGFKDNVVADIESLRIGVEAMITPRWHVKLKENSNYRIKIRELAKRILASLELKYMEPILYSEKYLNIDW
ncbi:hypothetical protein [Flavobacterium soli]|uniref:hypothetical protein n=1 Tax=Flavobacterium soli TaxID=344881 RepID=UPI00040AADB0|nr:hypothetical protein [Flavobacterium soli]